MKHSLECVRFFLREFRTSGQVHFKDTLSKGDTNNVKMAVFDSGWM
jgi:hypothetical protein